MKEIYDFKNIFRDTEKVTKKFVHLNSAIEINLYVICVKLKTNNENKHYFIINIFSDLVIVTSVITHLTVTISHIRVMAHQIIK